MLFGSREHPPIPTQDLLSWIFDNPTYDPDIPVYIDAADDSHSLSLNQSERLIKQLVAGFGATNLAPSSCVLVFGFNSIYYPILFLGIIAAGHTFAGANPAYTPVELSHHLKVTSAKFVIVEPELLEKAKQAAKENGIPPENILVFHSLREKANEQDLEGHKSWKSLLSHGEKHWESFNDEKTCKSRIACRLTSSGTTGLPKACSWTHYNILAEHTLTVPDMHDAKLKYYEPRMLGALPLFHAASVPRMNASALKLGCALYLMRRFDLEEFLQCIDRYKITELFAVPPIAVAISTSPLTNKKYSLRSVRSGISGAAPLSKDIQNMLLKHMHPDARYTQVYGMTESTCIMALVPFPTDDRTGSVGWLVAGMEMKIIDDDGKDITDYDTVGELCVRGPLIVDGYVGPGSEAANAQSFDKDGFYHTGDIGLVKKENGYIYIVDRKKDLIKVRAFQVAPAELEAQLLNHPNIIDAAVVGIPAKDPKDGEAPRAYVIKRPGTNVTEQEVKDWIRERLARYKSLDEGGVKFVDAIPKNPSGKILKRILRDQVKEEFKSTPRL